MVIPLPAGMIPQQVGPPTAYCMKMRPWFITVLGLQIFICVFRLFSMLDIWGGFIMAIGIAMGVYAVKEHMDIQWICYYGIFNLINGILDTVKTIDSAVKSPLPIFSGHASFGYNFMGAIIIGIPLCALLGAWMAYRLYSDFKGSPESRGYEVYGAAGSNSGSETGGRPSRNFAAFSGGGQRLGSA